MLPLTALATAAGMCMVWMWLQGQRRWYLFVRVLREVATSLSSGTPETGQGLLLGP